MPAQVTGLCRAEAIGAKILEVLFGLLLAKSKLTLAAGILTCAANTAKCLWIGGSAHDSTLVAAGLPETLLVICHKSP